MGNDVLHQVLSGTDAHTPHMIGLFGVWVAKESLHVAKGFLSEFREMKMSLMELNHKIAVVIDKVDSHEDRLRSLEEVKL